MGLIQDNPRLTGTFYFHLSGEPHVLYLAISIIFLYITWQYLFWVSFFRVCSFNVYIQIFSNFLKKNYWHIYIYLWWLYVYTVSSFHRIPFSVFSLSFIPVISFYPFSFWFDFLIFPSPYALICSPQFLFSKKLVFIPEMVSSFYTFKISFHKFFHHLTINFCHF